MSLVDTVIILLIAGAILLLLETILPGMVAGIAGLICLGAAVYLSYKNFSAPVANFIAVCVVAGVVVGALAWIKYLPRSPFGRIFMSQQTVGNIGTERPELLHQAGVALSDLRPSGVASINGQRVDVVTEGAHVEQGTPVKVVAVEGMRVVVRAA